MPSPLLVPLDDPDALDAALRSGADALVLDLGDAGAAGDRQARRRAVSAMLGTGGGCAGRPGRDPARADPGRPMVLVRVASLASGLADQDLDAVMAGAPDAVLLPGAVGARDVQHLAAKLGVREAEHGRAAGRTRIVAMPADTAAGVLALGTLAGASPRLLGLGWDPAALARDLGAGVAASPVRAARDLLLLAAAAAGLPALDVGPPAAGGADSVAAARRDGFSGRLAFRPDEVAATAAAFGQRPWTAVPSRGIP